MCDRTLFRVTPQHLSTVVPARSRIISFFSITTSTEPHSFSPHRVVFFVRRRLLLPFFPGPSIHLSIYPMTTPQAVNREDETAFVKNFIRDIPPVTRVLFFGTLFFTSLSLMGVLGFHHFFLDFHNLTKRFAVWTLFLSPLHAGESGFPFLMHLYFLYTYSKQVEANNFFGRASAYAWMCTVCLLVITPMALLLGFGLAGPALLMSIMHIWGRHAGEAVVTLYGIVPVPAKYLSLAIIGLKGILNGGVPIGDICGLLAGQLYYFMDSVYPNLPNGRAIIFVPGWFERLIGVLQDAGDRALGGTGNSAPPPGSRSRPAGGISTAPSGSAAGGRRPAFTQPEPRVAARHNWGSGRTLGTS